MVNRLTLVESAFVCPGQLDDSGDTCYNYARVLCHFGSLVMECRDAWAEGDGESDPLLEVVFATLSSSRPH